MVKRETEEIEIPERRSWENSREEADKNRAFYTGQIAHVGEGTGEKDINDS